MGFHWLSFIMLEVSVRYIARMRCDGGRMLVEKYQKIAADIKALTYISVDINFSIITLVWDALLFGTREVTGHKWHISKD